MKEYTLTIIIAGAMIACALIFMVRSWDKKPENKFSEYQIIPLSPIKLNEQINKLEENGWILITMGMGYDANQSSYLDVLYEYPKEGNVTIPVVLRKGSSYDFLFGRKNSSNFAEQLLN